MKRNNYLSWEEYFMGIAALSAMRSKDPNTQVGACIVNDDNRIVSIGYNGFPRGLSDDIFPWKNEGDILTSKYAYVVHAEANAILNARNTVFGTKIYVTLFPCHECSKLIIQSGIKEIIYADNKYENTSSHVAALKMLDAANVKYRKIEFGEVKYDRIIEKI